MPKAWRIHMLFLVMSILTWRSEIADAPRLWFGYTAGGGVVVYENGNATSLVLSAHVSDQRVALGLPVRLNIATTQELEMVPGIGPRTATKIVNSRRSDGCFDRLSSLTRVRGVGPKTVSKLAPYISLGDRHGGGCAVPRHG